MLATSKGSVTVAAILLALVALVTASGAGLFGAPHAQATGAAITDIGGVQCEDATDAGTQTNLWCCTTGNAVIDVTPPIISNIISTSITELGAIIQWGTDEDSTSKVNYGITSGSLSSEATSAGNTQTHGVQLSGLGADTTYYFAVTSCDAANNCKTSSDETSFKTLAVPPPLIALSLSGVTDSAITKDGATITWMTNKNSNSAVQYGTTIDLGQETSDGQTATSHSIQLSGLSADTAYYYKAKSCDASECVASGTLTFRTSSAPPGGDITPPAILNVENKAITKDSATITWDTNELADSLVKYGTTSGSLDKQERDGGRSFSHSIRLSNLAQGTQYYFTVTSCDILSNCKTSDETSFMTIVCTDADGDNYFAEGGACGRTDCNDGNAIVNAETTFYADVDNDKFGNLTDTKQACTLPQGYVSNSQDCSDSKANVNPTATEVCDGLDNNCKGGVDEGALPIYFKDNDGDGFGKASESITLQTCTATPPAGYVANGLDCNDAAIGITINIYYLDEDGDGFGNASAKKQACELPEGYVGDSQDCNDRVKDINPDEAEVCDGFDNNCAAGIDEPFDSDNDGFFNQTLCAKVAAYKDKLDFNDNSAISYPGASEICDGLDNNDDAATDNIKNSINPTITKCACSGLSASDVATQKKKDETANGIDDNCDGKRLKEEEDADSDGFGIFQGDCNDESTGINPNAIEICTDKIDNNCNGEIDDVAEGCTTNSATNIAQTTGSSSREEPSTTNATAAEQPVSSTSTTQAIFQGKKDDDIVIDAETGEAPKKSRLFLTIPASVILAIISAVYMLYIRPKQQLNNLSEQHDISSDASLSDTQAFVNSGLAQGLPQEQIQGHLQDQGVPQARIEQAIRLTSGDMKDLDDLAKKREVGYTREYEEGEKYVSECLDKGYSPVQVKTALLAAGWPKESVEKLIGIEVEGDLRKIAKQFGVDKKSADTEALQKFVKTAIKSGHTQETIKKVLADYGRDTGKAGL